MSRTWARQRRTYDRCSTGPREDRDGQGQIGKGRRKAEQCRAGQGNAGVGQGQVKGGFRAGQG